MRVKMRIRHGEGQRRSTIREEVGVICATLCLSLRSFQEEGTWKLDKEGVVETGCSVKLHTQNVGQQRAVRSAWQESLSIEKEDTVLSIDDAVGS